MKRIKPQVQKEEISEGFKVGLAGTMLIDPLGTAGKGSTLYWKRQQNLTRKNRGPRNELIPGGGRGCGGEGVSPIPVEGGIEEKD